jgi:hypothetical protein
LQTFIITAAFFALVMAAMAVGVIFSNRSLRGSCGRTGQGCECTPAKRRRCVVDHDAQH